MNKKNYIKITILFIGISLLAVLMLLNAREIYQLPRIHEMCGNYQLPGGTPDEDNVYNEITRVNIARHILDVRMALINIQEAF